jgi:hypothetical protein
VEVVDPVASLVHRNVLDVAVIGLGPEKAQPDVFLNVVGDPQGLLQGEEAVAGGEGSSDLRDVGEITDGWGLHVSVIVVVVGQVGDEVGRVVDPGVLGGAGTGVAGASADSGGVGDQAGPSELVGVSGADRVVGEGVFRLVAVSESAGRREGGGREGGPVVVGGSAVGVDVEGSVAGTAWEGELSDPQVLDVGAGGPGVVGVRVVEEPLQVMEVGDPKGHGAGGVGQGGEGEEGGLREADCVGHGWCHGGGGRCGCWVERELSIDLS